jgi:hypothetical protein
LVVVKRVVDTASDRDREALTAAAQLAARGLDDVRRHERSVAVLGREGLVLSNMPCATSKCVSIHLRSGREETSDIR